MTARAYKPYPAYKDSGVEWLGEIPTHWEVARLGEMTEVVNGYPFDSQFFTNGDGIPLVRIRDLASDRTEVNFTGAPVESAWIENDDVLVGMDGDFNVARWKGERALLNQRMCCVRSRRDTDSRFVAYLLPLPLQVINDLTYSTTVKHLASGDIRKIRLGGPPAAEQRAIATFLDRETARIDALVAKKERLITLLQERRTALITRAVTKGLDPAAPMKDSGVEWLGEIPAHWELKPLRTTVISCQNGVWGDDPDGDRDVVCVRVADFDRVALGVDISDPTLRAIEPRVVAERGLRSGDLLLEKSGGGENQPVGAVVIYSHSTTAVCSNFVARVVVSDTCDPQFLVYLHKALYAMRVNTRHIKQSTGIQNLDSSSYFGESVGVPTFAEQRVIAAQLARDTARIDDLMSRIQAAISRLHELRTALISAAVTGKIDVREAAQ